MKRILWCATLALGVVACVDTTLDTPSNHPANPSAHAATPAQPPPALSSGFDPFAAYANEAEPGAIAGEHDNSHGVQPESAATASSNAPSEAEPAASHDHATHAPSKAEKPAQAPADDVVVYTCPMHPEIIRNAPGNCPICGMKLVPKKSTKQSNP